MEIHLIKKMGEDPVKIELKQTERRKRASEILNWPTIHGAIKGPVEIKSTANYLIYQLTPESKDFETLLNTCIKEGHITTQDDVNHILITDGTFRFVISKDGFSFSIRDYERYEHACKQIFEVLKVLVENSLIDKALWWPPLFATYDNGKYVYCVFQHLQPDASNVYKMYDKNFEKFENCHKYRAKNGELVFMFTYEDPASFAEVQKPSFGTFVELSDSKNQFAVPVSILKFANNGISQYKVTVNVRYHPLGKSWDAKYTMIFTSNSLHEAIQELRKRLQLRGFEADFSKLANDAEEQMVIK